MLVKEFFHLNDEYVDELRTWTPSFGFNGYGEIVYYRTFSRLKPDDSRESWHDTCLRVINGIMSIRKNHYHANNIHWDEDKWQSFAFRMLRSMFYMEWLPPGRGLWQCGTTFMYERGSAALNNCGLTLVKTHRMHDDMSWAMDMLMLGVGIGFRLERSSVRPEITKPPFQYPFTVPDTREGWANSIRLLIKAYVTNATKFPVFDYSQLREVNTPIRGFGGTASGPAPLKFLHEQIHSFFGMYINGEIDEIELQANIANAIAVCVLAGNVRRSAEILQCEVEDTTFLDLKDGKKKPYRLDFSWTSNNSAIFTKKSSFQHMGEIARRVITKGEPGGVNELNLMYGRLKPKDIMMVEGGAIKPDKAIGFNPCGEQQLEDRELCCLVNTFPTRCTKDRHVFGGIRQVFCEQTWLQACEYAMFYAQTVTLMPTHDKTTNAVMQRNRRVGVAISDYTGWVENEELHNVIDWLKQGYNYLRQLNGRLADEAGVPHSIRITTVKPDGTVTKLAGVTSGAGYPTFVHTLRRTRFPRVSPITDALIAAGIPHEPDVNQPTTTVVFEYPILQGPAPPVSEVTIWQQAMNIVTLQRYWSDNAVSNTIYFEPDEYLEAQTVVYLPEGGRGVGSIDLPNGRRSVVEPHPNLPGVHVEKMYVKNPKSEVDIVEQVISTIMPMIKSFSMLPKSGPGVYPQMPESHLTEEEYNARLAAIKPIDWSKVTGNDAVGVKFCTTDQCET